MKVRVFSVNTLEMLLHFLFSFVIDVVGKMGVHLLLLSGDASRRRNKLEMRGAERNVSLNSLEKIIRKKVIKLPRVLVVISFR